MRCPYWLMAAAIDSVAVSQVGCLLVGDDNSFATCQDSGVGRFAVAAQRRIGALRTPALPERQPKDRYQDQETGHASAV